MIVGGVSIYEHNNIKHIYHGKNYLWISSSKFALEIRVVYKLGDTKNTNSSKKQKRAIRTFYIL